jgi:hypothetical protein
LREIKESPTGSFVGLVLEGSFISTESFF